MGNSSLLLSPPPLLIAWMIVMKRNTTMNWKMKNLWPTSKSTALSLGNPATSTADMVSTIGTSARKILRPRVGRIPGSTSATHYLINQSHGQ